MRHSGTKKVSASWAASWRAARCRAPRRRGTRRAAARRRCSTDTAAWWLGRSLCSCLHQGQVHVDVFVCM